MKIIRFILGVSIYFGVVNCFANDSIARVATGGITFQKSTDIQMAQEILDISTDTIGVQYRFRNKSPKEIHATIAFPMPAYSFNPGFSEYQRNNQPLATFSVQVNGNEVDYIRDRRAFVGDKDVTDKLRKIGLNDEQLFETFTFCEGSGETIEHCGITKSQEEQIEKIGGWKVRETALWEQTFPALQEITVSHKYEPFVGSHYSAPYQHGELSGVGDLGSDTCVDDITKQAIAKKIQTFAKKGASMVYVFVDEVEYILGTGRNWSGPIEDFKLRIHKKSPDEIVSLCFPGKPVRLDNLTFEFSQKNYLPQDRLRIDFYTVRGD